MDTPAMHASSEDTLSETGTGDNVCPMLTGNFILGGPFSIWAGCCGPRAHRPRDVDEEEESRIDVQTNVDLASRVVEGLASHDSTVDGEQPGWLAGLIRWPCWHRVSLPRPMPQQQPVNATDPGYPGSNQLVQHMGGQFQKTPTHKPPTLSSSDLGEPGASDDSGEGARPEDEASTPNPSNHFVVGDKIYTIVTMPAGHARQISPVLVQRSNQVVPAQYATSPAQATVAPRPSVGSPLPAGHSGESHPVQPEPAYIATGDSSIELGQHGIIMMYLSKPATR